MSKPNKYLIHFSEPLAAEITQTFLTTFAGKTFQQILTIPAYKEDTEFFTRLQTTFLNTHKLILIVVINQPDNSLQVKTDTAKNQQLWNHIIQRCEPQRHHSDFSLLKKNNAAIILINRFSEGKTIPHKQGVGLARKIACDTASHLIDKGIVCSDWIHTTDADTTLPDHYFSALKQQTNPLHSAAVYPFRHSDEETDVANATQRYEKALDYYVRGLAWAGSPYAFHTIGSCIAINAQHYMGVRGYPKRAGGEDFYCLNKLAKTGEILTVKDCELVIDSRLSDRVPFGTGPAVEKILGDETFSYYHPNVFVALKEILDLTSELFQVKPSPEKWLARIDHHHAKALQSIGVADFFAHLSSQIKNAVQCQQQFHSWLDAFKTLKLIHALEVFYPKLPLEQAIAEFDKLNGS